MTVEQLVVRIRGGSEPVQWAVLDEDGRVVRQIESGTLEHAADEAQGRRTVVLVPAVDVVSTEATLPRTSPAKQRKMLPFALEDALAEDVDELVFAVGPRLDSGAIAVAVAARDRLEGWLAEVSAASLSPAAVYSEADGVPDTPSTLTLLIEDERVFGRAPGRPPFVFEGLSLGQIVDVADGAAELKHALVYVDEAGSGRFADDLEALGERIENTQVKLMSDGALYRLGATVAARPGTNLLQGRYAPRSNAGTLLRPWRAAAALLVGLLVVSFVGQAAEYWSLRQQRATLDERLASACAETFSIPDLGACGQAARARLGESGMLESAGPGFLTALTAVAEARAPESRISALSYRNGVMDLQLVVPDVPALDAFARDVESGERFDVRIQNTGPEGDGVEGRVQIVQSGADR